MQRPLWQLLILMLGFAVCANSTHASSFPDATSEERRDSARIVVAPSNTMPLLPNEPVTAVSPNTDDAVAEKMPDSQTSPAPNQNATKHHGHFLRNALIGLGAMCVFAIVLAMADK